MPSPGGWFRCEVGKTGAAEDGTIFVTLKDTGGTFGPRWFSANVQIRREVLATALAAISMNHLVDAALVSADEYSTINRMYVVKPGY